MTLPGEVYELFQSEHAGPAGVPKLAEPAAGADPASRTAEHTSRREETRGNPDLARAYRSLHQQLRSGPDATFRPCESQGKWGSLRGPAD